ncbi:23451_t:CDS:1, partial [Racocetra persica]
MSNSKDNHKEKQSKITSFSFEIQAPKKQKPLYTLNKNENKSLFNEDFDL